MSAQNEAIDVGEAIRVFAGPALSGWGSPGEGWVARSRGEDRVWVRREAGGASFVSEGAISGPMRVVAGLIKEAEIGGLAGALRRWRSFRASPCVELVSYTSRLPWPLADRSFGVLERYGGGPEEALILGQDAVDAVLDEVSAAVPAAVRQAYEAEVAEAGTVDGSVRCSAYRIVPEGAGCRLRRLTRIDLRLPLPEAWTEALLARTFLEDLEKLRAGAARPPEGLAARMAADPIYAVWGG